MCLIFITKRRSTDGRENLHESIYNDQKTIHEPNQRVSVGDGSISWLMASRNYIFLFAFSLSLSLVGRTVFLNGIWRLKMCVCVFRRRF